MSPFYFHSQIIIRHVPCDARLTLRLWVLFTVFPKHNLSNETPWAVLSHDAIVRFLLLEGLLKMK